MKKITQKHIADQLSISITAVSKALKDSNDISEETKKRVLQTAQDLGYRNMQKINPKFQNNILLFLPFDRPYKPLGETSVYFFISALFAKFKNLDYQIIVLPNSHPDDIKYIEKMNFLYKPSAMVITDTIARDPRVLYCLEKDITVVTQGQTDIYSQYFCVDFNEAGWITEVTDYFFAKGVKDPLLILPKLPMICIDHRHNAFIMQMKKYGLNYAAKNNLFFWEDSTILDELETFIKSRSALPDMVIFDSEYMVMQYQKLIKQYNDHPLPFMASATNVIDLALTLDTKCYYCWQDFWQIGQKLAKILLYALTTDKKNWQLQHHIEPLISFNPYEPP